MQHDACGVGFIADLGRRSSHDIVEHGLTALRRLAHRGASPDLGAVDGCGLMTAIPWPFVETSFGERLPTGRSRALGVVFAAPCDRHRAVQAIEGELVRAGAVGIAWRDVPIDAAAVLAGQRATTPAVLQVAAAFPDSDKVAAAKLYRVRLRIEAAARRNHMNVTVVSLSTKTVVYKGLLTPQALPQIYGD